MKGFRWSWPSLSAIERYVILALWAVLFVLLFFRFVISPTRGLLSLVREEAGLVKSMAESKLELVSLSAQQEKLRSRLEALNLATAENKKEQQLPEGIIPQNRVYPYLSSLVFLLGKDHLQFVSLKVDKGQPFDLSALNLEANGMAVEKLPIHLVLEGNYSSFLDFISQLEETTRLPRIATLALTPVRYPKLQGTLTLYVYDYKVQRND